MDIDKIIRREIEKSGKTAYRLAAETGLKQEQFYRFMKYGKTFTLETAGVVLDYFGYELKKKPAKQKKDK